MNSRRAASLKLAALLGAMILSIWTGITAQAGDQSDDNSLSSLGITTQGVTVSPDFSYDHLTYDVVVPAGTTQLDLEPVLSNPDATINSIDGTTLVNGTGTVTITTTAPSGAMTAYTLNVTTAADTNADPAQAISEQEQQRAQSESQTQPETQTETQSETEDPRYVKVDRNTLQDAEDTISRLQTDLQVYKDRSHQFTYVIYALIAGCVVLLFLVVNLAIRRKDLAAELKEYRKKGGPGAALDDYGDVIPQDGWLDDEPDEPAGKKGKKQRGRDVPRYDRKGNPPASGQAVPYGTRVNAQTSWTQQQVGTPMEMPKTRTEYDGYAGRSQAEQKGKKMSSVSDDTKMYQVSSSAYKDPDAFVPGDDTIVLPDRKLTRAEKSAAKKAARQAEKTERKVGKAQNSGDISDSRAGQQGQVRKQDEAARHMPAETDGSAMAGEARQNSRQGKGQGKGTDVSGQGGSEAGKAGQDVTVDMIDL